MKNLMRQVTLHSYPSAAIIRYLTFLRRIALCITGEHSLPWLHDSFTLCPEFGDINAPSEHHVCYTLRRGSSYAVAVYPTDSTVYAILRPSATFCLSTVAICTISHTPHLSV